MTIYKFTGGTTAEDAEVNRNFNDLFSLTIKNAIRMLDDRNVDYSADEQDLWAEAYTDDGGQINSIVPNVAQPVIYNDIAYGTYPETPYDEDSRENGTVDTNFWTIATVDQGSQSSWTNSIIDKKFYLYGYGNDNGERGAVTMTSNAEPALDTGREYYIGFYASTYNSEPNSGPAVTTITFGGVDLYTENRNSTGTTVTYKLIHIKYDGASWEWLDLIAGGSYADFTPSDGEYEFYASATGGTDPNERSTATVYVYFCGYGLTSNIIEHTIPTGSFSATLSSAIGSALFNATETGATVDFKLTGSGEDSGWLTENEITEFTAFASEATTLLVRMNPASSSPTPGLPQLRGFGVRGG